MGSGLRCLFKEGTDAIIINTHSSLFGTVGRILGYTDDACVLLRF
jgi:hypothetical protein